jgi:glucose-6-phosphate isomerase
MSYDTRILRDRDSGMLVDFTHAPPLRSEMDGPMAQALQTMAALEAGAIANRTEARMVGHYWLRDAERSPTPEIRAEIERTVTRIQALEVGHIHEIVMVGIGGSALGPQLVHDCLAEPGEPFRVSFLDNTDPDGHARALRSLDLGHACFVVISKSGGTSETANGLEAVRAACGTAGISFEERAIAITGEGSVLHQEANGWKHRFPMWDWVGGRTSVTGPVGLVMMALTRRDIPGFLEGARTADAWTRRPLAQNPAAQLAAAWFHAGNGRGDRALVIEPYRDRFQLLSRYLQQLVMESIGKEHDRQGRQVHQGLTVYGNKGSTDQHAFVQQLRDGRDDAFVHFIEVLDTGDGRYDPRLQSADTLVGLRLGTEEALANCGRPSVSIQVPDASAHSLGMLVALFERAVGLYAELVDVNAYDQPGVEAGKKAAKGVLEVLNRLEWALPEGWETAQVLAQRVEAEPRIVWRLLHHLAATGRALVAVEDRPESDRFSRKES